MSKYQGIVKIAEENDIPNIWMWLKVGKRTISNWRWELEFTPDDWRQNGEFVFEYLFEKYGCVYSYVDFDNKWVVLTQYGEWDEAEQMFIPNNVIAQSNEILKKCAIA